MLGEKIGEFTGKEAGFRVLPGDDYRYVKMEITFEEQGTALGVAAMNRGTLVAYERNGGQMYSEGQGILMTMDGESAIWKGHGVGLPSGEGMAMNTRYSVAFQAPVTGKLAALNGYLAVGEFDVDAQGNIKNTVWAWK